MNIRDIDLLDLIEIYTATRRRLGEDSVEAQILRRELGRRDRAAKDANRQAAEQGAVANA